MTAVELVKPVEVDVYVLSLVPTADILQDVEEMVAALVVVVVVVFEEDVMPVARDIEVAVALDVKVRMKVPMLRRERHQRRPSVSRRRSTMLNPKDLELTSLRAHESQSLRAHHPNMATRVKSH